MAAGDLTTLDNLKAWMPIPSTTTTQDAVLARLISAVSADFTRCTKRPDLLTAQYTEVHMGDGATRMIAFHWPITAIATLQVGAATITASADKVAAGWYLDEDIDPERVWAIYLNGSCFTDGQPVKLSYTAGYATVPGDIEQAVIDWCLYRYKGVPNVSTLQRRSSEGDSVQVQQIDAPPQVLSVIDRYTRVSPCLDRRQEEREERLTRSNPKQAMKGRR